ncbi:MAG TPA: acetyl-CoA carboxylase biotin carboxyl carrier protein subunit [Chloroflexi bacterium]|nr:acetyl-CoA carboxylase biotin carboxyl carrier protein subunit [Chloroflexota bacterium]HHW87847.1 biotin/lipoyl-binding protein [Chloroflexota bacterium]
MHKLTIIVENKPHEVEVTPSRTTPGEYTVVVDGELRTVFVPDYDTPELADWMIVDDRPYELNFSPDLRVAQIYSGRYDVQVRDKEIGGARPASGDGRVKAPIPGLITRIHVEVGQLVEVGQPLLVLEAMKMENEIRAPIKGVVHQIAVKPGQTVTLGEVMAEIQ